MISAVVDANVLVAGSITDKPSSASKSVIDALLAARFLLVLSPPAIEEIERVLLQPSIQEKHGQSTTEVDDFADTLKFTVAC